jgi:hypothetical protein
MVQPMVGSPGLAASIQGRFFAFQGEPTMTVMDYWLQSIGVRWLDQARAIGAKLEETGSGR